MFGVVLMVTLKLQKIVVTAIVFVGELAAYRRASAVDRATARFGVEEPTYSAEVCILLASHNALMTVVRFGEFLLCFCDCYAVVLC